MPKCPSCGKQDLPRYDWLVFGEAKCRTCGAFAEHGAIAKKYGVRSILLVPLVLILVAIFHQGMSRKLFVVGALLGFVAWVLAQYFSRPVLYTGEYPIGPSLPDRLLAPFILVLSTGLLIYVAYTLFTEP
jgi:hypothetical protein